MPAGAVATLDLALDPAAPPPLAGGVTITSPHDGDEVGENQVMVAGVAKVPGLAHVKVAGTEVSFGADGHFQSVATLVGGLNTIAVHATDSSGHSFDATVWVTYTPPAADTPPQPLNTTGCSSAPPGLAALWAAGLALLARRRRPSASQAV